MLKTRVVAMIVFLKTLTFLKLWNSFLLRLSYILSKRFKSYIHWGFPESLSVEPTNLCNLKCPECPSGNNKMTRPRLFLAIEDFKSIVDQTGKYLVNLQLFFQGEPFMHPKVYDYIAYASSKGIYTSTSTNGHFLNPKNCDNIINAGLKRLIVSLDGTSQESYQKYRVGGNLNTVLSGIENILKARTQCGKRYPQVILQFVIFSTNEHQIPQIKQLAKELGVDELQLKSAQIDDFELGNDLMPKNPQYSRYVKNHAGYYTLARKQNFKCKRVWNGSVVSANGALLPCCFDKNAEHAYQNNINGIKGAWKAFNAKQFRKKVWRDPKQFNMCRNCSEGLK